MNIILLGPPVTGKGTQAEIIKKTLGIPHISTGQMFRDLKDEGDELGVQAYEDYWKDGNLVPDSITIELVKKRLSKEDCKRGYVLDGFPRTIPQAEALEKITSIDLVINISTSDEKIFERIDKRRICTRCGAVYGLEKMPQIENICDSCGGKLYKRNDDTREIMSRRLEVYRRQTAPLIEFYQEKGLLVDVDGNQPLNKVTEDILKILR